MSDEALLSLERKHFHGALLGNVLSMKDGIPSNADKANLTSVQIASHILTSLGSQAEREKEAGQRSGARFEVHCEQFLNATFPRLKHLRPGQWRIARGASIAGFEQYRHLSSLEVAAAKDPAVAMALGNDYLIRPDVVVVRRTESDEALNEAVRLVDDGVAKQASLREINGGLALLHASISCKWTLRSDRAQNARSEALNLIRNRKGPLPHVAVVTAEPLPSRLASLALGTGDLDCVYHFALPELQAAVGTIGQSEAVSLLQNMIEGRRLKDISDLPLDLAI